MRGWFALAFMAVLFALTVAAVCASCSTTKVYPVQPVVVVREVPVYEPQGCGETCWYDPTDAEPKGPI